MCLCMYNILNSFDKYSLDLLKQCRPMLSNSAASCFYTHLYNENNQSRLKNTLFLRVNNICIKQNINVIKYVFNDSYALGVRRKFKNVTKSGVNGFIDSIRYLLLNYNYENRSLIMKIDHCYRVC